MRSMKRIIVSLCMAAILLFPTSVSVLASDGDFEKDTSILETPIASSVDFSSAKTISVNKKVKGHLTRGYDYEKKVYRFKTQADGYIRLQFQNPEQYTTDACWNYYLYNANYVQIDSGTVYGNRTVTNSTAMGLAKGTYFIVVQSPSWNSARTTDTYSLKVAYKKTDYWEKELNDDFRIATNIKVNQKYQGTTKAGYDYEKDYFRFKLPKDGYVRVRMDYPQQETSDAYWTLTLFNAKYESICSRSIHGNYSWAALPYIGLAKGTYYVSIQSSSWNRCTTSVYSLNVNFKQSSLWEKEFNDSFVSATKIKTGNSYNGTIKGGYDYEKDLYKVKLDMKKKWKVTIKTKQQGTASNCWRVILYDGVYNQVGSFEVPGNRTTTSFSKRLKKGTYYIEVKSTSWNTCVSDPYQVIVS